MRKTLVIFLASAWLSGCAELFDGWEYEFTDAICSTGRHTFYSRDAYCNALRSASLNRYCAYEQRRYAFLEDCEGFFVEGE